ncbi:MAG: transcriptional regulator [Polyangiaceae bacterium]|nr:transcriptional regulator [Polyangiaceae bacterium]
MATTTLPEFLRARRERLQPASTERRRTPGLRREEVAARADVTPALQRVLDNLRVPALVKTPTFQIVAWNRAAVAVIGDYAAIPERERNMLRRVFHPEAAAFLPHADDMRRTCLAAFRVDVARAGATEEAAALVDELMETSEDFRRLWAENELHTHGVRHRRLFKPTVGELVFEASTFSVDDSDGLSMVVLSPVDDDSARGVEQLIRELAE